MERINIEVYKQNILVRIKYFTFEDVPMPNITQMADPNETHLYAPGQRFSTAQSTMLGGM
jgi:hypothetical protein